MRGGRRPPTSPAKSPAVQDRERQAILHRDFRNDLTYWIGSDPRIALRVMKLVEEVLRAPFAGIGKPEPLRHSLRGEWSRRITDHHRMEYVVSSLGIQFIRARSHYQR